MNWVSNRPVSPGWYWWTELRLGERYGPYVVRVYKWYEQLVVAFPGSEVTDALSGSDFDQSLWAGPIPELASPDALVVPAPPPEGGVSVGHGKVAVLTKVPNQALGVGTKEEK